MGQTMTRERRTIENSERDCREKVAKEQDDQRKALQRAARAGKAGALKSCKFGEDKANTRRETGLAEQNRRNEIIAAEHMARKTLKVVEDEDRNKAREATYAADNGSGGQNRVLCRREAHVRLEIEDQQEAEREQCQIGYLMDVPGTHSAEHVRAMDKLKQQQAEEFAARARKRSLLQMEDLSVLNFENSEGPAHPAHSIQAGESLPATPPDTGEEEEQPVFTPESHASTP
ncbi:hypothetical protein DIPPA_28707 [Diplonema papillatum]|nr:hypothetical protein DIPPA_28707 [Diplonema papillatum]